MLPAEDLLVYVLCADGLVAARIIALPLPALARAHAEPSTPDAYRGLPTAKSRYPCGMRMWHTFGMSSESMTTIKVPKHLRERLSRNAGQAGLTAAALISELLDERERQARFEAVRRAYEASADETYAAETQDWDSLAGDGLAS
jgi:hypothetical protein